MANLEWRKNPNGLTFAPNWILQDWDLEDNKWFISYNPNPTIGSEGPETAIVSNRTYYILLGDHREGYKLAAERDGFGGCLRYFNEHRDQEGSWSDALPEKENG